MMLLHHELFEHHEHHEIMNIINIMNIMNIISILILIITILRIISIIYRVMLQNIRCFRFEQRSASPEGKYYYFRPARCLTWPIDHITHRI